MWLASAIQHEVSLCIALLLQIEDYSLVSFVPLDITKNESVARTLAHIDGAIQFGEDAEPKIPRDLDTDASEA